MRVIKIHKFKERLKHLTEEADKIWDYDFELGDELHEQIDKAIRLVDDKNYKGADNLLSSIATIIALHDA